MQLNEPLPLEPVRCPHAIRRFLALVSVEPDGAWRWTGAKDRKGYGRFKYRGHMLCAHRVSYAIFRGPVPAGHHVHHVEPDPSNVHPDNLEVVTPSVNTFHSNVSPRRNRTRPASGEIPV